MRNFRFIFKISWFSSPSKKVWTSLSISDTDFFSVLAAMIRENSDKKLVLRIVKALPFIHQPDQVAPKASDVSAADWLYQHTWKNTIFFHVCCYGFSQGRKSFHNTAVYVIKPVSESLKKHATYSIKLAQTFDHCVGWVRLLLHRTHVTNNVFLDSSPTFDKFSTFVFQSHLPGFLRSLFQVVSFV